VFAHLIARAARPLALTLLVTIAVACGSTQPTNRPTVNPTPTPGATQAPTLTPQPSATPSASPDPNALLLEVTTEGGFISPAAHLGQLPTVVVDASGHIYTPDLDTAPPLLIPRVVRRDVGPEGAAQILSAIKDAGLDEEGTASGGPSNPDAGVTVFTVVVDGQEVVNRIVDGGGPGRPGSSPSPAMDLLNRLVDGTEMWGATGVVQKPFTPSAYKIYFAPTTDETAATVAWPLSTGLADFGTPATPDFGVNGLRTGAVTGDDALKIATAFGPATPDSLSRSAGDIYQIWIRPLLPPELN
jgi:hypothetical protein